MSEMYPPHYPRCTNPSEEDCERDCETCEYFGDDEMSMADNDELRARIRDLEEENTALRRVLEKTTHEKSKIECLCLKFRAKLADAGIEVD